MSEVQTTFTLNAETAIPAVGFGTYLISNEDAEGSIRSAIAAGYRHIDTASGYRNEETVGAGIRKGLEAEGLARADLFITAKLWPGNPAWGDAPKTGTQTIAECDASLSRLGIDHVDLYLIHAPYGGDLRLEQWRALLDLQASGKARAVGVSNFNESHLDEIALAGLPMPDANQIELHPWSQKPDLLAHMASHDIAPIAYSSLVPLSTWRTEPGQESAKTDEMKADGTAFQSMAEKYGVSEAQLLLRWGVQNGYAVLPKSLNPERMRQNLDLFSFAIDEADMAQMATMDRGDGVAWASGDPSK
ncbi:aldo/keto reductase [Pontivivens insulae]|uniref:Putative oxidoreductase/MSMEI_2347 n=1 Tax=Pontivivens insulae TaxID=1639689 RepID=A0A2R8A940_9RHOB|nr:aldo/keto reductase [Pontivivens insulae]RED18842.1 diketogulonate reductase-like aldo/keto reductase [Pontivivens insulae]SPF28742.1 putative oxidoreductase/MSMEI_2347 [Pontivivens insulae]